jgi:hypothetical protein
MKRIIKLTERDLTRIVRRVINESEESSQPTDCVTKLFKQSEIDTEGMDDFFSGPIEITTLKTMLLTSGTRFKVKDTYGSVNLNRKPAYEGAIITPDTTITICGSGYITMSGMGYPEAMLYYEDGNLMFKKQYA